MTGRTHDLAAFTALGVVVLLHPELPKITLATGLVAVIANMIGGIAPDLDQPTAPFWRNLPVGKYVGKVLSPLTGGHRFLSHSLLGIGIFGAGFYYLLQILKPSFPALDMHLIWLAFMIGFISHLCMDSFTREGVPWFLPIPIKLGLPPVRSLRVPTGGFLERFIIFPGLILINGYLFYINHNKILDLLHHHLK